MKIQEREGKHDTTTSYYANTKLVTSPFSGPNAVIKSPVVIQNFSKCYENICNDEMYQLFHSINRNGTVHLQNETFFLNSTLNKKINIIHLAIK